MRCTRRSTMVQMFPAMSETAFFRAVNIKLALLLFVAGSLLLASCAGAATPSPTPIQSPTASPTLTPTRAPRPTLAIETSLTAAERAAIFETAWQTVNDEYFDPTFGGKDWQVIGDSYRQKLAAIEDDRAFWLEVLNPMLFELGVSHIAALPPKFSSQMEPMTFSSGMLGMDVRLLEGAPVITEVRTGFPADAAGLRPGYVIATLNGRTPEDIAANSLQTPPDNERNRRANLIQDMRSLLYGKPGDEVAVEYWDGKDRLQRTVLRYAERSASTCAPFDPSLPPACTELEVKRLADGIGYIRFSGFLATALDGVLKAIDDLHEAPVLIIDLRGNPGGVFPVRKAIASKLVGERRPFIRYQYRDGSEETYLDRVTDPYRGKVVLLVDELSASSSEEFAGSLQALGRATVVGLQTPGRCLVANIAPLPNDAVMIYPVGQSQTPDGRVLENNGVVPDIEVVLDREQLLQGRDTQLEAAITFAQGQIVTGDGPAPLTASPAPTTDKAIATEATPTPRPTAPTATPNPGWIEYRNDLFGYSLRLPEQATVEALAPEYFPPDELPSGTSYEAYLEQLRQRYQGVCVRVRYGLGYAYISAPLNTGARYSPCGRTGVGDSTMITQTLTLPIDGALYEATEMEFISPPGETLVDHSDYVMVRLDDGSRIEIGSVPGKARWQDYVESTRDVLLQIVGSYQSLDGVTAEPPDQNQP